MSFFVRLVVRVYKRFSFVSMEKGSGGDTTKNLKGRVPKVSKDGRTTTLQVPLKASGQQNQLRSILRGVVNPPRDSPSQSSNSATVEPKDGSVDVEKKGISDSQSKPDGVSSTEVHAATAVHEQVANPNVESQVPEVPKPVNDQPMPAKVTFAEKVSISTPKPTKNVNFRKVDTIACPDGRYQALIPLSSVRTVNERLSNSIYGYFIGKRIAFPVVENYVYNTWAKYGIQKIMMNSKGFFFFRFATEKGVNDVLEGGPWMIRNVPIILNKWSPDANLSKDTHQTVPIWVKMSEVPLGAFTEDGLSVIASQVGEPLRLDEYTSQMCKESWGRSSFARAMIEVNANEELKDEVVIGVPSLDGNSVGCAKIKLEYDWKPPQCMECKIFGHTNDSCPKNVKPAFTKPAEQNVKNTGGFQQQKRKGFKQKTQLIYRPVNKGGQSNKGKAVATETTSNSFASLANLNDSAGSSEKTPQVNEKLNSDAINKGVGKDQGYAEYVDSDGDDVLHVYDEESNCESDQILKGASTPSLDVPNV